MLARPARVTLLTTLATLATPLAAQTQHPIDEEAIQILREHGLGEKSQVMETLSWICDVHGPRLTGSPNLRRAQTWALETLTKWGLTNAHLEEWGPFGRGWRLDHFSISALGQNPWPVHAFPKAWSPSLDGRVEADVINVAALTADQVRELDLSDKIVLVQTPREVSEPFDGPAQRHDAESLLALADARSGNRRRGRRPGGEDWRAAFRRQQAVMQLVYEKKPLAILDRGSKGDYGTIFVQSASLPAPPGTPRNERPRPWDPKGHAIIPQFTLAVEHYNRICRLLDKQIPVRLALELKATYFDDDPMERNVIAEIAGTDPEIGDELVMIGAHFDSWQSGTGATDNGCGSAVMMEAARLLTELVKAKGEGPRRTIRIGLWSGEEQGLLGSRNYVTQHFGERGDGPMKPAHEKFSAYYNLDNGTGRIRGVYLQGNEACGPIFRSWLRPFHDLDATTITINNTGGTDHQAFDGVGLPGFQFIQDAVAYSTQTHHSNMDNWDHAIASDLEQAATIIASFAWHTAQRDAKLPRKPRRTAEASARPANRRGR